MACRLGPAWGYNPPVLFSLLADTEPSNAEKIEALRYGFILIVTVGIVGILLIVLLLGAWRNFHKRLGQIEADRDAARESTDPGDVWQASGQRVAVEPAPPPPGSEDDTDDEDLYGKDWEPGDDDENPDDEDQPW